MCGPEMQAMLVGLDRPALIRRIPWSPLLLAGLLATAFAGTAHALVHEWRVRDDYSHAFLVPLVSGYLVWVRRDRLRATDLHPDYLPGLPLLFMGCLLLLAGRAGSLAAAEQVSLLLVLPGLLLILLGRAAVRELLFPLAYLVLMVPAALDPLIGQLHWPLQLFGAWGATELVRLAGIPVLRYQQFIGLPNATLEVANVCSGVRYLISVVALSIPLAHVSLRRPRHHFLLILAALAVGILANPIRIALISLWVYHRGPDTIHGPGHILQGFFVSLAGFLFLFFVAAAISWKSGRPRGVPAAAVKPDALIAPPSAGGGRPSGTSWVLAMIPLGLTAGFLHLRQPVSVPLPGALTSLPLSIGEWQGADVAVPVSPLRLSEADAQLERVYRSPGSEGVRLYVGYLGSQAQGRELVFYTFQPIYDRSTSEDLFPAGTAKGKVSLAVMPGSGERQVIYYWYDLSGRVEGRPHWLKVLTAIRGLTSGKTDGALVAISRKVHVTHDLPAAIEEIKRFAHAVQPHLHEALWGKAVAGETGATSSSTTSPGPRGPG